MSGITIRTLELGLGQTKLICHLFGSYQALQKSVCVQCVRFYRPRKPFWLPMGKTKMFRIPKHPEIPKEEDIELSRLYNVYRTNMKSLRQYFKEELVAQSTGQEVIQEREKRMAEQHALCIKENELWNAEVAKLRENRLAKEAVEREEAILQKIMDHEQKQKLWMEQLDAHVRSEKESAKTFITPENIDDAIEIALVSVVDHNFCIDKEGQVYVGRYGKPPPKPTLTSATPKQAESKVPLEAVN